MSPMSKFTAFFKLLFVTCTWALCWQVFVRHKNINLDGFVSAWSNLTSASQNNEALIVGTISRLSASPDGTWPAALASLKNASLEWGERLTRLNLSPSEYCTGVSPRQSSRFITFVDTQGAGRGLSHKTQDVTTALRIAVYLNRTLILFKPDLQSKHHPKPDNFDYANYYDFTFLRAHVIDSCQNMTDALNQTYALRNYTCVIPVLPLAEKMLIPQESDVVSIHFTGKFRISKTVEVPLCFKMTVESSELQSQRLLPLSPLVRAATLWLQSHLHFNQNNFYCVMHVRRGDRGRLPCHKSKVLQETLPDKIVAKLTDWMGIPLDTPIYVATNEKKLSYLSQLQHLLPNSLFQSNISLFQTDIFRNDNYLIYTVENALRINAPCQITNEELCSREKAVNYRNLTLNRFRK